MRALRISAMVVGGVVILAGALFAFLQTPPGQRALAGLASDETVHVSGLSGFFPTDLQVARVELLDEQGTWLTVDNARLRWSLASLLTGRVRIDMLQASLVDVLRAPVPSKAKPGSGGGSFTLPVGVDVQELSVDTLHLAEPLAGVDSRWTSAWQWPVVRRPARGPSASLRRPHRRTVGQARGRCSLRSGKTHRRR